MVERVRKEVVRIGELEIHYSVVGEGEPLVLVHGLSGSWLWWSRNVKELAKGYRVYLVDLPGFGAMWRFRNQFHLSKVALQLDLWARAVGLESACFIGHSMGGYVCLALAKLNPPLVSRLILVATTGVPTYRSVLTGIFPMAKAVIRTRPSFWPILLYDALRAGPILLFRAASQVVSQDASGLLSAIRVPTLLIWGEHDDLVPLKSGRQLRHLLPESRLFVIAHANHICMFDQPAIFNAAVQKFLKGEPVGD